MSEQVPTVSPVEAGGKNVDVLSISIDLYLLTSWSFRSNRFCFVFVFFMVFFHFINEVQFGFLYFQDFLPEGFLLLLQLD